MNVGLLISVRVLNGLIVVLNVKKTTLSYIYKIKELTIQSVLSIKKILIVMQYIEMVIYINVKNVLKDILLIRNKYVNEYYHKNVLHIIQYRNFDFMILLYICI